MWEIRAVFLLAKMKFFPVDVSLLIGQNTQPTVICILHDMRVWLKVSIATDVASTALLAKQREALSRAFHPCLVNDSGSFCQRSHAIVDPWTKTVVNRRRTISPWFLKMPLVLLGECL